MVPRRVLVITRWFPTPGQPAQGTFVRDWAQLSARTADVTVLHLVPGGPGPLERAQESADADIAVYRLRIAWRGVRAPISHLRDIWAASSAITELNREQQFDLFHAHTYPVATSVRPAARRCGVPYVVTEHFSRLIRGDDRWYHRWEARYAFRAAAAVTAVGPALAAAIERLARRSVNVLPNPVPDEFASAPPAEHGPPFRILSVGHLDRIKGFDVALEALAELVRRLDVNWAIVGEGEERENLKAQARRLGVADRVEFVGLVSRSEVHRLMASSHVIVVPSRTETFSVVAAEALMTGRPVVTTRCGGPESFIGEEGGRIVAVDDPTGLAAGIEDVVTRLERFPPDRLAAKARSLFSEAVVAAQLKEVYERTVN